MEVLEDRVMEDWTRSCETGGCDEQGIMPFELCLTIKLVSFLEDATHFKLGLRDPVS